MKKTMITGVLAVALITTGGTGLYMASAKENPSSPFDYMKQHGTNFENMSSIMGEGNFENMQKFMGEQGVDLQEMNQMMESGNFEDMQKFMDEQNINFGQMKPHMQKMHPDLSNQDLEEMYKSMHGTGGADNSQNFQGMN